MTPDLHKRLLNPKQARDFIDKFDWGPLAKPEWIVLSGNREVPLDTTKLNDDDVVAAALSILIDVEIPMVLRTKKFERWDQ